LPPLPTKELAEVTLVYLSLAWLFGIYLASRAAFPAHLFLLISLVPLLALIVGRRHQRVRVLSSLMLSLCLGAARYQVARPEARLSALATYNDHGPVLIQGTVVAYPDVRATSINLRVRVRRLRLLEVPESQAGWRDVDGLVLVQTARYPEWSYGDELEINGLLERPPELEDFSYRDYLARQGIASIMRRAQVMRLAQGKGSPFYAVLYGLRAQAQRVIASILPEPQAALLMGILLGVQSTVPKSLMDAFSLTGTTHILVISGFNISIIARLLTGLSTRLAGRRWSVFLTVAGIALYTLLVGADAAVTRAAIMGGLGIVALHLGRQTEALTSLLASAWLMTAINPLSLWDLGFQLSFMATLGLILFAPELQKWSEAGLRRVWSAEIRRRVLDVLNDALLVTLAAQVMTLPLIVANFGRLSLVTLLTNLLVLPAQPAVMIMGGLATVAGLLSLPLGRVLGWLAWLPLTWTVMAVEATARWPWAAIDLGRFSPWWLVGYYLLLGGIWLSRQEGQQKDHAREWLARQVPRFGLLGLAAGAVLIWAAVFSLPDGRLHITFLDVGQGDAIFIESPDGAQILVDGGPEGSAVLAHLGRHLPFWDRDLDLVVLTHPDNDHLLGLLPVLERYRVKRILDVGWKCAEPAYQRWQELVNTRQIPVTRARGGVEIRLENEVTLRVLHPSWSGDSSPDCGPEANDLSLVLRVAMDRVSVLLTGDLEAAGEAALIEAGQPLSSTVLKVGHHGGAASTSRAFLKAVAPQLAVISVGAQNRFGHPAPEVLDRLAPIPVFRTDERGSIELITDGQRLWVKTSRNASP